MRNIPRRRNRLPQSEYLGKKWYFLTFCCHRRIPHFESVEAGNWFLRSLKLAASCHGFFVTAYCVMPDHVHLLLYGSRPTSDLVSFTKGLKGATARAWWREYQNRLWQPRYYDHILRGKDGPHRVAGYIWMNPVRKGLCRDPREYPLSGSFTEVWNTKPRRAGVWLPPWKVKTQDRVGPKNEGRTRHHMYQ